MEYVGPVRTLSVALALMCGGTIVHADTYRIDSQHVWLIFSLQQYVFGKAIGQFSHVRGQIIFDKDNALASSVTAEITVDSVSTGDEDRDTEVRQFFHEEAHPTITFASTGIDVLDAAHGRVTGDLNLAGNTTSVTMEVTFNGAADSMFDGRPTVGFSAKGALDLKALGIYGWQDLKLGPEVDYQIEVQAIAVQ